MDKIKQKLALAEIHGWSQVHDANSIVLGGCWVGYPPSGQIIGQYEYLPDYLNDLNVVHEIEKLLDASQWLDYSIYLGGCVEDPGVEDWKRICHATAAEKCEILLKVFNKWVED